MSEDRQNYDKSIVYNPRGQLNQDIYARYYTLELVPQISITYGEDNTYTIRTTRDHLTYYQFPWYTLILYGHPKDEYLHLSVPRVELYPDMDHLVLGMGETPETARHILYIVNMISRQLSNYLTPRVSAILLSNGGTIYHNDLMGVTNIHQGSLSYGVLAEEDTKTHEYNITNRDINTTIGPYIIGN